MSRCISTPFTFLRWVSSTQVSHFHTRERHHQKHGIILNIQITRQKHTTPKQVKFIELSTVGRYRFRDQHEYKGCISGPTHTNCCFHPDPIKSTHFQYHRPCNNLPPPNKVESIGRSEVKYTGEHFFFTLLLPLPPVSSIPKATPTCWISQPLFTSALYLPVAL